MTKNFFMILLGFANSAAALIVTAVLVFSVYTYVPKEILGEKQKELVILFACGPSFLSVYIACIANKGLFFFLNGSKIKIDDDNILVSTLSCLFFYELCLVVGYACLCIYVKDVPKIPILILGTALGVGAFFGAASGGIPESI